MTAAKAPRAARKPRVRKPGKDIVPKPPADIVPRSPFTGWGAVDGLVWRARHAVEAPVFWNRVDLDAAEKDRRDSVEAGAAALTASYDLNYYRALPDWGAFPGEDERWQWYRLGKRAAAVGDAAHKQAADAWNAWDTAMADAARDTADAEVAHEPHPPAHPKPHLSGPLPAVAGPMPSWIDDDDELDEKIKAIFGGVKFRAIRDDTAWSGMRLAPGDVPGPVEDPPTPGPGTPGEDKADGDE